MRVIRHMAVRLSGLLGMVFLIGCGSIAAVKPSEPADGLKHLGGLASVYSYKPFHPSSAMPDHLWMENGIGKMVFLHFDKPVTDSTARVVFAGEGIFGRFCTEDQPEGGKAGFVHFHRFATPKAEIGHGGIAGEEGYWLKHYAIAEFDMMGKHFTPGIVMDFMPTTPPTCGS